MDVSNRIASLLATLVLGFAAFLSVLAQIEQLNSTGNAETTNVSPEFIQQPDSDDGFFNGFSSYLRGLFG